MARTAAQLPKGRHGLSRAEVESSQRTRILVGMAEAMGERGFVDTTVADVIGRAGVSRESFYRLFSSKDACFAAAFDQAAAILLQRITTASTTPTEPFARVEQAITTYLDTLAAEPAWARLFVVEVHAAGADAMRRRFALQDRIVDAFTELLGAGDDDARFAVQVVVAAMSSMVTRPLLDGDPDALRALGPPMLEHLRTIWPALT